MRNSLSFRQLPADSLKEIFTDEFVDRWKKAIKPSEDVKFRIDVVSARRASCSNVEAQLKNSWLIARKIAWEAYLDAGFACGMFDGPHGQDLRARLRDTSDENFRSAMDECMTAWFFLKRLGITVRPYPPGRDKKVMEMEVAVKDMQIGVEVKSPYDEPIEEVPWGDGSEKLKEVVRTGNKQFRKTCPNILVICPRIKGIPMFRFRLPLIRAAFVEPKLTFLLNKETGETTPPENRFFPEGQFLNTKKPSGKPIKPTGEPAYRRISAIVCIEEEVIEKYPHPVTLMLHGKEKLFGLDYKKMLSLHFSDKNKAWLKHNVLVLHNPHAYHPLATEIFKKYPQCVPNNGKLTWTDGYNLI